jgi:cytochrome c peroxidase
VRFGITGRRMFMQAATAIGLVLACLADGGANPPPLGQVPVPEPPNLSDFVRNRDAAVRLGKAFFWDMQTGSDGIQACATCHFHAGADNRLRNSVNPGTIGGDAVFDVGGGVNYLLQPLDFPFFDVFPQTFPLPPLGTGIVTRNINDVVGSQGIPLTLLDVFVFGTPAESGTPIADAVFSLGGSNIRQVTGRNTPSVINAVFNFTNFWDGRADNIFNGSSPFGPLDPDAGIWLDDGTSLVKRQVTIRNASLASQATGPPLSDVEMSFRGRSFPQLGRKMLGLTPLGKQAVHPADGVLGGLSNAALSPGAKGLSATYDGMIREAFQGGLWSSPFTTPDGFTQMEANFSLFWGLAIQLYEATLVSDRTPFDRFLAGNLNAMSKPAQRGFAIFTEKCVVCHSGSELTSAATGSSLSKTNSDANPAVFVNNTAHSLIRQGLTNVSAGITDAGFFNIGVRPTADDPGRGGSAPFVNPLTGLGFPLSFSRLAELQGVGTLPFVSPLLPAGVPATRADAVQGAFKVPGLRNVELTAPYFHNGSAFTLDQVVEFYVRGGNFANPELAAAIAPIGKLRSSSADRGDLVAFLTALTDERVRSEAAPFDHPEIVLPDGDPANGGTTITLPATGGALPVVVPALILTSVTTPTPSSTQTIGGAVDADAAVTVSVNGAPALPAKVTGQSWSFTVTGLVLGLNSITVTAVNLSGGTRTVTATIQLLPTATVTGAPLTATKETGATLTVGGTGVVSYRFRIDGGPFSGDFAVASPLVISGLPDGLHTVSVLGTDAAGNLQAASSPTTVSWRVKATPPVLTIDQVKTPDWRSTQTIGGTVEIGVVPVVKIDTSAAVDFLTITSGVWSCRITGLQKGSNNIMVTATDVVGNATTKSTGITIILPDGSFQGNGVVEVVDALKALRIALGIVTPTPEERLHGDVAPLAGGFPAPDDRIDMADALVILRKAVGLEIF